MIVRPLTPTEETRVLAQIEAIGPATREQQLEMLVRLFIKASENEAQAAGNGARDIAAAKLMSAGVVAAAKRLLRGG